MQRKTLTPACLAALVLAAPALAVDYGDKAALDAGLDKMTAECRGAGGDDCVRQCETSKRIVGSAFAKSVLNKTEVSNAWKLCEAKHEVAMKPKVELDPSRWVVAGVALGDPIGKLLAAHPKHNLEMTGRDEPGKKEKAVTTVLNGAAADPAPKFVRFQHAKVFGNPYLEADADGDGNLYAVFFRQKGDIDPDEAAKLVLDRFGPPTHRQDGHNMSWGACATGPCADFTASGSRIEIRIQDVARQDAGLKKYRAAAVGDGKPKF